MSKRTAPNVGESSSRTRPATLGAVTLALLLAFAASAQAATYYWDNNGITAGFGTAGGTWGTSTFWNTSGTGAPAPTFASPTTTSDNLNFGNGGTGLAAGTVSVTGATQAFSTMTFASGSGAIVISGGTSVTLASASTITVDNTADAIATPLVGVGSSLTKAGAGTLTLNGASTYSGATNVSGGTLVVSSVGSINSASATTVASGGTLTIAAGTTGGRTFSNNITLTGGTVQGVLDNIGSGGTVTVGAVGGNVVHTFTGSGTLTIPVTLTANGGVVVGGGGGAGGGRGSTGNRGGGGGGGDVNLLTGFGISAGATSVTVGAGGAGGVQGLNSGTGGATGGTSSLGAILSAAGGVFGKSTGQSYAGGASGSGNAGGAASGTTGGGGGGDGGAASGTTPGPGTTVGTFGTFGAGGLGSGVAAGGANTGKGGGGGAPGNGVASGAGGSGIVIVQYAYGFAGGMVTLNGSIDVQQASTLDAYGAGGLLIIAGSLFTSTGPGGITIASSGNVGGVVRYDSAANYLGNTTVNGGATLLVNGSLVGTSAVTVQNLGTIGGNGTIFGSVTVDNGGTFAPGNSIDQINVGSLALNGNLLVEVLASAIDRVDVAGLLDLSGSTDSLTISGTLSDPAYIIASYGSISGTFSTLTNLQGYSVDYAYQGNQVALVLLTVPAPAELPAGLALLLLAAVSGRRLAKIKAGRHA